MMLVVVCDLTRQRCRKCDKCKGEKKAEDGFPTGELMDLIKAEQEGRLVILPFPIGCTFRHHLDLRLPQEQRDYWELHHDLSVAIQAKQHGTGKYAFFPLDAFRVGNQLWENTMVSEMDGATDKNVGHTIPVNDLYDEEGGDVMKEKEPEG